jgi:hypothetical protein
MRAVRNLLNAFIGQVRFFIYKPLISRVKIGERLQLLFIPYIAGKKWDDSCKRSDSDLFV